MEKSLQINKKEGRGECLSLLNCLNIPGLDKFFPALKVSKETIPFPFSEFISGAFEGIKKILLQKQEDFHGDPYGNRTHVTAVKGRCLNRLTNGPGSGNLVRTDDIPGMNRVLYQLSYAAMWSGAVSAPPKSASLLYLQGPFLSSIFFRFYK